MDFKEGRALVTGGARGIGRAICEALLRRRCKVCCTDINVENGKRTVEELQKIYGESNCIFLKCDVSSSEEFEEVYLKAKKYFGNLNILVNNAGVVDGDKVVDINLKGTIYGCDLAFKYMGKNNGGDGGIVINISSAVALQVFPSVPVYSATKAGILSLTRCYGQKEHYESSKIKFIVVCPSAVNTDLFKHALNSNKTSRDIIERYPRLEPCELAEVIIELIEEGRNGAAVVAMKREGKMYDYVEFSEEKYVK